MNVTEQSFSAIRLQMYFDDTFVSYGTGFFWEYKERIFLVTNWHNISGRNRLTGVPLSPTLALPNSLKAVVFLEKEVKKNEFERKVITIRWPLDKATNWLVHEKFGPDVDIIMHDVTNLVGKAAIPVNAQKNRTPHVLVASDVYLLGFPLGIEIEDLPVWKRGTIASEPDVDVDDLPKILVDSTTSSGMSGAPVIFKLSTWSDGTSFTTSSSDRVFLVGVYSGRVQKDGDLSAQIGEVWKASLLEEIARSGVPFIPE